MDLLTPENFQNVCRFCLKKSTAMRQITADKLAQTDLPSLFEMVTAVKLVISVDYSEFVCTICEDRMNTVAQIRWDFLKIDSIWKNFLSSRFSNSNNKQDVSVALNQCIKDEDNVENSLSRALIKCEAMTEENVTDESDDHFVELLLQEKTELDSSDDDEALVNLKRTQLNSNSKSGKSKGRPLGKKTKDEARFECEICSEKIQTKRLLQKHMTIHRRTIASTQLQVCHVCGKTNLKSLVKHLREHRKAGQFKCPYCHKGFNRNLDMEQHQRVHTGERPFVCEICAFSFTSASGLHRHRKMHSMDIPGSSRKAQRVKTQIIVPPAPPKPAIVLTKQSPKVAKLKLVCPLCQGTFVNRTSVHQHLKLMHHPHGIEVYKRMLEVTCMVCHKIFPTTDELVTHKPIHTEHECTICRRRYDNKLTLHYHMQTHTTKERPHECEECGRAFALKKNLSQHFRRSHTENRPHICGVCGKSFVEGCNLNAHIRMVHSQARPFQCTDCPKAYKTAALLRYHQEKHTGQFRYSCSVCSKPCHTGPLLTAHMQMYHPDVAD